MFYLHKLFINEVGQEQSFIDKRPSKTYQRALTRAKKAQNVLIMQFPNKPVALIRNGIEVFHV